MADIILKNEDGMDVKFKFLDMLKYKDNEYMVLRKSGSARSQITVLLCEEEEADSDMDSFVTVDLETEKAVLKLYHKVKLTDISVYAALFIAFFFISVKVSTPYIKSWRVDNDLKNRAVETCILYSTPSDRATAPFSCDISELLSKGSGIHSGIYTCNGLYGYMKKDGTPLTDPVFQEAHQFCDGTAGVRQNGIYFFIDEDGNRIAKNTYSEGSDTFEMQGMYFRVKTRDGYWGIINRADELVFSGADSIEELPYVTTLGSAIVDGKPILLSFERLFDPEGKEIRVIPIKGDFSKISPTHYGSFAFVWNAEGLKGVVDYNGTVVIPAEFVDIDYKYYNSEFLFYCFDSEKYVVRKLSI